MTGAVAQPEQPVGPGRAQIPPTLPGQDVQEVIIDLVRSSSLVSPAVAPGAPITWIPGVEEPWITVTEEAVHLAVVAHSWPIVGMLMGLRERVRVVAHPRTVTLSCVDIDTEHDASGVG